MRKLLILGLIAVGLAACGPTRQDRAVTGGLVGAGAGALIGGAATGRAGGAIAGGLIGGAAGAVIGANSGPQWCEGVDRRGRVYQYRC